MTANEELEELKKALRSKTQANAQINRLQAFKFKTPGIKSDLRTWYERLDAADLTINRILNN